MTLSVSLLFSLSLSHCLKFPKRAASVGRLWQRRLGSGHALLPMSLTQSACLPPPSHIQSVSMLSLTYLMVFIYLFHVWFWCCPPPWCGVKYLQGFCFGLYWVGLWWVQTCHLYHIEAFSNRKHSLRGWALGPLLSFYFYFGVRQWKLCTPWENHFKARTRTGERGEMGEMKANGKRVRAEGRKTQAKWALANRWHAAC